MDYITIMCILFWVCLTVSGAIFSSKMRAAQSGLLIRLISALFIFFGILHLFSSIDYLISALRHTLSSSIFASANVNAHNIIQKLRNSAQADGIASLVLLLAWRTGLPACIGFGEISDEEVELCLARIEAWQSVALFCSIVFLTSAIIRIVIFAIPLV